MFLDLNNLSSEVATEFGVSYVEAITQNFSDANGHKSFYEGSQTPGHVWGVGLAMVTLICSSAAIGFLLFPLLSKVVYERVLTFLIALGVGTLSGSATFHLIPEAFDLNDHLAKAWMIIAGIYLFYLFDNILNTVYHLKQKTSIQPAGLSSVKYIGNAVGDAANLPAPERRTSFPEWTESAETEGPTIASLAWLIVFGDSIHNLIDGLSIGVAYARSFVDGLSVSIAILCEEIPHKLGDCAIMIGSGMSNRQALLYSVLASIPCFPGFVVGVLVGQLSDVFEQFVFAIAGGMFLYAALTCTLGDMNKKAAEALKESFWAGVSMTALQASGIIVGLVIMYIFAQFELPINAR